MEKDRILSDLMSVTVECANAKMIAETLRINSSISASELELLRAQVQVLTDRQRSFSDVSGASQLAATLQLSEELEIQDLGGIKQGEKTNSGDMKNDSVEKLLTEISRLTTSLEIKEEALQNMHLQLVEARRTSGMDDPRSYAGHDSPYREMFANSEAEMSRLKVRYVTVRYGMPDLTKQ